VAVKAAHFARPPGLGLDGREHGDNIRVRRGSEYSIRTLQNADEKHGASTDFFNRCTWYLIPSRYTPCEALYRSKKCMIDEGNGRYTPCEAMVKATKSKKKKK
jgi:hypothetical protein